MFHTRIVTGLAAATLVLAGAPAAAMAAPPVQRYQMVDLGTLGGSSSYAVASNDRGAVTGRSQVSDDIWHGFLWQIIVASDESRPGLEPAAQAECLLDHGTADAPDLPPLP